MTNWVVSSSNFLISIVYDTKVLCFSNTKLVKLLKIAYTLFVCQRVYGIFPKKLYLYYALRYTFKRMYFHTV